MDKQALARMDEQADKAIANRSLSALMVNMLPPPLVHRALGKVVFEIGEDLSEIYAVEKDTPLFKDLAGAVVDDLTKAYKSQPDENQSHLEHLKYIPGVNIWVGMMMQSHTATAVTRSVGHAFKHYFHAQVEKRNVDPQEVAQIAANFFRETLSSCSEDEEVASDQANP
ncbi:MAG TPA: hypothetical protein VJM12_03365 [Pyrinomonadaceae bacterium]|nr:hypothetical protein [Pyrinomonadaceae bacterium]